MPLALLLVLATQMSSGGSDDLLLKIGDRAPPFSMRDLDRQVFSLAHHTGPSATEPKKAVFIVFFATWCEPCKKEIPIVKRVHARWAAKGVEVIYIGLSQGPKELKPFAAQANMPWRVVPDSFGLLSRRYGAAQLPHVLLINSAGNIAFQHRGIAPDLQRTIEEAISKATGIAVPPGLDEGGAAAVAQTYEKKLILGRAPSGDGSTDRWQPLGIYLRDMVKAEIDLASEPSYAQFEKALKAGKYDIANAGPLVCNEVKKVYEPLVTLERQGTPTYLGLIFAMRASRLKKLGDLKGKTVGLVSPKSTSGGLYPQQALLKAGLIPGKNVTIKWLGSHSKVAAAVKDGIVDAGGCYEDCRDAVWSNQRGKAIATVVLDYTEEIPAEMIIVRRGLDAKTKADLRKALLGLNENTGIMTQISRGELPLTAVAEASDADLAPVAKAIKYVASKTKKKK